MFVSNMQGLTVVFDWFSPILGRVWMVSWYLKKPSCGTEIVFYWETTISSGWTVHTLRVWCRVSVSLLLLVSWVPIIDVNMLLIYENSSFGTLVGISLWELADFVSCPAMSGTVVVFDFCIFLYFYKNAQNSRQKRLRTFVES